MTQQILDAEYDYVGFNQPNLRLIVDPSADPIAWHLSTYPFEKGDREGFVA